MQRVKYDPEAWVDLAAGKTAPVPPDAHVRLSKPGTLSAKFYNEWRLVGYGTEFKVTFPGPTDVKADVPFAVFVSVDTAVQSVGVPLTNFDKRPGESSVERIVKKALIEDRLRRAQKDAQRREADKAEAKRRFEAGLEDEPRMQPEPEPVPEPVEEAPVDETATEPAV